MWLLIKGTFWFSLVLVLLPFFDTAEPLAPDTAPKMNVGDTVSAASEALGYIGALCVQKPDVCVKGTETFTALGHRAKDGARIAYEFLDTRFGEGGDPVTTGTVKATDPVRPPAHASAASRDESLETEEADTLPATRIPVPEPRLDPAR